MTSPNFPFLEEIGLSDAVESMIASRLNIVAGAIDHLNEAVGVENIAHQNGDNYPGNESDTAETTTSQETGNDREIVTGDAHEVPDGVTDIVEYWNKEEMIADARQKAEMARRRGMERQAA